MPVASLVCCSTPAPAMHCPIALLLLVSIYIYIPPQLAFQADLTLALAPSRMMWRLDAERGRAFFAFGYHTNQHNNTWTQLYADLAPGCDAVAAYSQDNSDFSQQGNGEVQGAWYTVDSIDRELFPPQV